MGRGSWPQGLEAADPAQLPALGAVPLCMVDALSASCLQGCEFCSKHTKGQEFNWFEQMVE